MNQRLARSGAKADSASWILMAVFAFAVAEPAVCAEFKALPLPLEPDPRTGAVAMPHGERVTAQVLERAVRTDAASVWTRSDDGVGLSTRVEAVTWRDGALGCPLAGRMYTQMPILGWRVFVSDGSREFVYHASADGRWLLCPPNRVQPPLMDSTR